MTSNIPVSASRKKSSGGNLWVELAFTLLPTFALVFAFCDVGLMIFRWNTLQNAVREGCRYAVTFQTMPGLHQDASIATVVQTYALNFVKTTDTNPVTIFVKYYSPNNLNTPINSGGNIPGNVVEVSVQNVSLSWLAPLSGTLAGPLYASAPVNVKVYSLDTLGGYPVGVTSVQE